MTFYSPYKKGTVLAPAGRKNHLHVICNNPIHYPINNCDYVLVVNITSIYPNVPYDKTCLLNTGDHDFIKHPSYVFYGDAIICQVPNIMLRVKNNDIIPHKDMPTCTFNRILTGFNISEQISLSNLKFYKKFC